MSTQDNGYVRGQIVRVRRGEDVWNVQLLNNFSNGECIGKTLNRKGRQLMMLVRIGDIVHEENSAPDNRNIEERI